MAHLNKLAVKLGTHGPGQTEKTERKIQVLFGGSYIIRSTNSLFVWENPYYPQYYFRRSELESFAKQENFSLTAGEEIKSGSGVVATRYTLKTASGRSTNDLLFWSDSLTGAAEVLRGLVKIDFDAVDQWFEEDTPIYIHPKDPYKRIDILESRRPITVKVAGHVIAQSPYSFHLHETSLIRRFYIPYTAYDASVLRPSKKRSGCPYKGEAEYYDVEVGGKTYENLVWYYRTPTTESLAIVGLLSPYNEMVEIELDGVKLETPGSAFT